MKRLQEGADFKNFLRVLWRIKVGYNCTNEIVKSTILKIKYLYVSWHCPFKNSLQEQERPDLYVEYE
jgi:hypothetical protein